MEKIEGGIDDLLRQKAQGMQIEDYEYKVRTLEDDRKKKLLEEEERWRQKNRAIWITIGDKNTKFFHRFASYRRNKNHIWEIEDDLGKVHSHLEDIKNVAINYYKSYYRASESNQIGEQVETARLFPGMVKEEDATALEKPCTKEEILEVLKGFTKDKSHGPDGQTVEFFLHYFELVGQDLLEIGRGHVAVDPVV